MSKVNQFLEDKVMPVAAKVAQQRHLNALRDGLILSMPLIIIGSFFLILANFPIQPYMDFLAERPQLKESLLYPYRGTFELMTLIAVFGISYRLAESYKVDPLAAGAVSLSAYFVGTPYVTYIIGKTPEGIDITETAYQTAMFTSKGLFVGMLIALLCTEIYRFIVQRNLVIKLPDGVPPAVARSFTALIPGFFAIIAIWVIRLLVENVGSFGSIHNVITVLLQKPLTSIGTSLAGTMIIFLLITLLWSTGLHGATIVGAVTGPIWLTLTAENAKSFELGEPVQHIVTNEINDIVFIGGSGTTLGLVLAMLLFAKSQQMKQLGRLSIGPGIFNINEPVLFGMPIVMNPLLIVPFIFTPLVSVLITYLAMDWGIVAKPIGIVPPWTMPPILQGYLITGSISGAILQIVILALSFLIYYPFFRLWDKQKAAEEKAGGEEQ
ncbi:PTS cellobiose transporter subunit IIC [Terribacillus saccharophilus]|uniref:PTS cellobiose transporter subunit IIC n=1 Tax=Terribacillus saccharophilus TaxID=361277 RepID=UPI002989E564|nr:PTS cellobiose transporter subunit IIC [Terribacillus saccharophilus]MCM3226682.1 PTS cellobiose transporter subunit IIC [Terribacillus saccharophilus]